MENAFRRLYQDNRQQEPIAYQDRQQQHITIGQAHAESRKGVLVSGEQIGGGLPTGSGTREQ